MFFMALKEIMQGVVWATIQAKAVMTKLQGMVGSSICLHSIYAFDEM
jgi:hypothetical protein